MSEDRILLHLSTMWLMRKIGSLTFVASENSLNMMVKFCRHLWPLIPFEYISKISVSFFHIMLTHFDPISYTFGWMSLSIWFLWSSMPASIICAENDPWLICKAISSFSKYFYFCWLVEINSTGSCWMIGRKKSLLSVCFLMNFLLFTVFIN